MAQVRGFSFDEVKAFLAAKGTDSARRREWVRERCIGMVDGVIVRDGVPVELSAEDEAADDWIVYRRP